MTHTLARSLALVGCTALVAWTSGCAAPSDEPEAAEEESAEVASAAGATPANIALQKKVTTAFSVAMGLSSKALILNHACTTGKAGAMTALLDALAGMKQNLDDGYATLQAPSLTTILNLKAVSRPLKMSSSFRASINSPPLPMPAGLYLQKLQTSFVDCWGDGVKPFVYLGSDGATGYFDPEPVNLTQSLSGSTGASAAAVYSNSQSATTVRYWSGSYGPNSLGLSAGTPCSTSGLSSSSVALKVIQVYSSYAKCI